MKKKNLIIGGIILLIILAIYGVTGKKNAGLVPNVTPTPNETIIPKTTFPPQKNIVEDTQKDYSIVYDPNYEMYIISVLNTSFDKIRLLAEQDLLKKLNLSQENACTQLKVSIGSPYYVNPGQKETYDTFSFCSN